jgi:Holliday junction resolvase RusA-like endonuclease
MGVTTGFVFRAVGVPVQQGSKSARVFAGRAQLFDQNAKALHPWRRLVRSAAEAALLLDPQHFEGPVEVELRFEMPRPKTVKRRWPSVKPDLDKLTRAVLDSLTDAGVWGDDAQVVRLQAEKTYARELPGVTVHVRSIEEETERSR